MKKIQSVIAQYMLMIWGWKIEGYFFTDILKSVIVVAPHRKGFQDVLLGWCVQTLKPIPSKRFLIKYEAFHNPFYGWIMKKLGGFPIDRKRDKGSGVAKGEYLKKLEELVHSVDQISLVMTPEGTRKETAIETPEGIFESGAPFQKGFYKISLGANLPVILVAYDYKRKVVIISKPFYFTGNVTEDLEKVRLWYHATLPWYMPRIDDEYFM